MASLSNNNPSQSRVYQEAAKYLFLDEKKRIPFVLISFLFCPVIGIIAVVYLIKGIMSKKKGLKLQALQDWYSAESLATSSYAFGILAILTIIICHKQLPYIGKQYPPPAA